MARTWRQGGFGHSGKSTRDRPKDGPSWNAAARYTVRRPVMKLIRNTTRAITSRRWMRPPATWKTPHPSSQATNRITASHTSMEKPSNERATSTSGPQTIAAPVVGVCDPIHMCSSLIGNFLPGVGIHVTAGGCLINSEQIANPGLELPWLAQPAPDGAVEV